MALAINWIFIGRLEGAGIARGYVPNPDTSNSGVTIATGFDLGQRSRDEIEAMGLPEDLAAKLVPYAGLRGRAAVECLNARPLLLEAGEVAAIDGAVRAAFAGRLADLYNVAVSSGDDLAKFEDLPDPAQTVIASVAYQYGLDLKHRTPRFWSVVVAQNWPDVVTELRNFGDAYAKRRQQEADLLETLTSTAG
ncbi:MAG TPA: pesticin C-terminus-like muramidase [Stellaceae bacterium]|nr:pesticin C-terminus-like muramidase [Stellaceae bacterium]